MLNYKEKYLKYKEKYFKLKNQTGSAPLDDVYPEPLIIPPIIPLSLLDLPFEPLLDNIDVLSQIKLATTDRRYRDAFSRRYSGYNSTFAPDIVINNNNIICNNQPGCNKFIIHYRIKDILNRNKDFLEKNELDIPDDGIDIKPILDEILLNTIRTNNESDAEFLVSIGVTIEVIDGKSFRGQKLNAVYIPSSVTRISDYAFIENSLVTVKIPNSVTIIGIGAFAYNKLVKVILPESLINIDTSAFAYNKLVNVILPESLINIERSAFINNKLECIRIPPNVTNIGTYAFANNLLIDINIPDSVIDIGSFAFECNRLKTVNIGRNVLRIGTKAFKDNQINNVTIRNNFIKEIHRIFDNIPQINFNYYL